MAEENTQPNVQIGNQPPSDAPNTQAPTTITDANAVGENTDTPSSVEGSNVPAAPVSNQNNTYPTTVDNSNVAPAPMENTPAEGGEGVTITPVAPVAETQASDIPVATESTAEVPAQVATEPVMNITENGDPATPATAQPKPNMQAPTPASIDTTNNPSVPTNEQTPIQPTPTGGMNGTLPPLPDTSVSENTMNTDGSIANVGDNAATQQSGTMENAQGIKETIPEPQGPQSDGIPAGMTVGMDATSNDPDPVTPDEMTNGTQQNTTNTTNTMPSNGVLAPQSTQANAVNEVVQQPAMEAEVPAAIPNETSSADAVNPESTDSTQKKTENEKIEADKTNSVDENLDSSKKKDSFDFAQVSKFMTIGIVLFVFVLIGIITFMFTQTTSIIQDPDLGESILFEGAYNASTQVSTWRLFPGISVSKAGAMSAANGQTMQIVCPLENGSEPWQIIPLIFNVDESKCVARPQVNIN